MKSKATITLTESDDGHIKIDVEIEPKGERGAENVCKEIADVWIRSFLESLNENDRIIVDKPNDRMN